MTYSHILRFSRQMERYYNDCFADLTAQTGVSMNELRVLLFLANNPDCDTARDIVELRDWPSLRYPRRWSNWSGGACWSAARMTRTGGSSV